MIVPDRHGTGTNALLLAPPERDRAAFGPGSRERHAAAARGGRRAAARSRSCRRSCSTSTPPTTSRRCAPRSTRAAAAPRTRAALLARLRAAAAMPPSVIRRSRCRACPRSARATTSPRCWPPRGGRCAPATSLVVAHKVVSKAEGRVRRARGRRRPASAPASSRAEHGKDPRHVQVMLDETAEVVRARARRADLPHAPRLRVRERGRRRVQRRAATARSSCCRATPTRSARALRAGRCGARRAPAVVITDSFGRAWRHGPVRRRDRLRRPRPARGLARAPRRATAASCARPWIAVADEAAAAADLVARQGLARAGGASSAASSATSRADDGPGAARRSSATLGRGPVPAQPPRRTGAPGPTPRGVRAPGHVAGRCHSASGTVDPAELRDGRSVDERARRLGPPRRQWSCRGYHRVVGARRRARRGSRPREVPVRLVHRRTRRSRSPSATPERTAVGRACPPVAPAWPSRALRASSSDALHRAHRWARRPPRVPHVAVRGVDEAAEHCAARDATRSGPGRRGRGRRRRGVLGGPATSPGCASGCHPIGGSRAPPRGGGDAAQPAGGAATVSLRRPPSDRRRRQPAGPQ